MSQPKSYISFQKFVVASMTFCCLENKKHTIFYVISGSSNSRKFFEKIKKEFYFFVLLLSSRALDSNNLKEEKKNKYKNSITFNQNLIVSQDLVFILPQYNSFHFFTSCIISERIRLKNAFQLKYNKVLCIFMYICLLI